MIPALYCYSFTHLRLHIDYHSASELNVADIGSHYWLMVKHNRTQRVCKRCWRHDMKRFPVTYTFTKARLWCFLCCLPGQAVLQTVKMPVAWCAMIPICHCNDFNKNKGRESWGRISISQTIYTQIYFAFFMLSVNPYCSRFLHWHDDAQCQWSHFVGYG